MRSFGHQRHHDARTWDRGKSPVRRWGLGGGRTKETSDLYLDCGDQAHWTDPRGQPVALQMQYATLGMADLSGGHLLRKGKVLQVKKGHQDKITGGCA